MIVFSRFPLYRLFIQGEFLMSNEQRKVVVEMLGIAGFVGWNSHAPHPISEALLFDSATAAAQHMRHPRFGNAWQLREVIVRQAPARKAESGEEFSHYVLQVTDAYGKVFVASLRGGVYWTQTWDRVEVYDATRDGTSAMLNRVQERQRELLLANKQGVVFKAVPVIPGGEIRTVGAVI
jgi:hypothetical protein